MISPKLKRTLFILANARLTRFHLAYYPMHRIIDNRENYASATKNRARWLSTETPTIESWLCKRQILWVFGLAGVATCSRKYSGMAWAAVTAAPESNASLPGTTGLPPRARLPVKCQRHQRPTKNLSCPQKTNRNRPRPRALRVKPAPR